MGDIGSKITIAPSNLKFLSEAIKHYLVNDKSVDIHANTVFEEGWTIEDAQLFYKELIDIADFMLDNDYEDIYVSLFEEDMFVPMDPEDNGNWCGGTGAMVALDYKGDIFPLVYVI